MRRTATIAAALALSVLAAPALAADPAPHFGGGHSSGGMLKGGYLALRGGITAVQETEFDPASLGIARVDNEYEDLNGFASVAAGMAFGATRFEADVSYLRGSVKDHIATAGGTSTRYSSDESFGDLDVVTVMANLYYDLDLGFITPFVGAGLGVGFVSANDYGVTPLVGATPDGVLLNDNDLGLAYQATAGLAFAVGGRATAELGYRFQGVEAELHTLLSDDREEFDIETHTGFAGIRVSF